MGKFAHCYDLPAGEQLLVVAYDDEDHGPCIQYATEIHGEQVTAQIQMLDDEQLTQHIMRIQALADAKRSISLYDEDTVLAIRRKFVAEHDDPKGENHV